MQATRRLLLFARLIILGVTCFEFKAADHNTVELLAVSHWNDIYNVGFCYEDKFG